MAKTVVITRSRIQEAGEWGRKKTHEAVQHALEEGEKQGNIYIERQNSAEGYNLPADVEHHQTGFHDGYIIYPHFFGRFFESGFYSYPGRPFMRPASRKMRSAFKKDMSNLFRGFRGLR